MKTTKECLKKITANEETVFISCLPTASKMAQEELPKQRQRRITHDCLSLHSALHPCEHFVMKKMELVKVPYQEVMGLRVKLSSFHIYYLFLSFHLLDGIRIKMKNLWCFIINFLLWSYMCPLPKINQTHKKVSNERSQNNPTIQCWNFQTFLYVYTYI